MAGRTVLSKAQQGNGSDSNGSDSNGGGEKSLMKKILRYVHPGAHGAADKAQRMERKRKWMTNNPGKDPNEHKDEWQ